MISPQIDNSSASGHELIQFMLEATKRIGHDQIFLLIDLCDIQLPLLPTIADWQPPLDYWLLFEQTPEASIREDGPLLLLLNINDLNHLALLEKIGQCCDNDNRLIGFNSIFPSKIIGPHLRTALQLRWQDEEGEQNGLLRYYTPDLFEAVNSVFNPSQYHWFHQYMLQWFFRPDGGECQLLSVAGLSQNQPESTISELVFTSEQYDLLLLWADVFAFYRNFRSQLQPEHYGGQRLLLLKLYAIACGAAEEKIYSQNELNQYFWQELQKQCYSCC